MFSFFLIIFIFVENLLIAAGIVIDEKLPVTQKAVDLSKRNLGNNPLHFLAAMLLVSLQNLSVANIHTLNLSHNNLAEIPDIFLQLVNLTCLYVNDNRLSSLPESMRRLKGLQELDLRNNQLKGLDVVRELPKLKKLLVEGNPFTLEEIRSLMKHVHTTTRTIFVDIAGSVTYKYGNKSFAYSSTTLSWCRDCVSLALW